MSKPPVNQYPEYLFVRLQHIRTARAWLGWNLHKMGEMSGLALDTISRYERGAKKVLPETIAIMCRTFQREGVHVLPNGIRMREISQ
jgi:hypothetical protein